MSGGSSFVFLVLVSRDGERGLRIRRMRGWRRVGIVLPHRGEGIIEGGDGQITLIEEAVTVGTVVIRMPWF